MNHAAAKPKSFCSFFLILSFGSTTPLRFGHKYHYNYRYIQRIHTRNQQQRKATQLQQQLWLPRKSEVFDRFLQRSPYYHHCCNIASIENNESRSNVGASEMKDDGTVDQKQKPTIILWHATIHDITTLLEWGEKEHVQQSGGDPDDSDCNWEYESQRNNELSWRLQLIAEVVVESHPTHQTRHVPIGFVQIIDPCEEESHYWGIGSESNLRAIDIMDC